ncbi:MAG: hypothetical protein ABI661_12115 [Gammaproteobacteria bacterium]
MAASLRWVFYQSLIPASENLIGALPVDHDSHLGGVLYDAPRALPLLTAVVFVMGMINSYFTPERSRATLAARQSPTLSSHLAQLRNPAGTSLRCGGKKLR